MSVADHADFARDFSAWRGTALGMMIGALTIHGIQPGPLFMTQQTTLAYGIGNWHLVRGDTARAREWFERSVRSGGWPAFGFIVSEAELRRLR